MKRYMLSAIALVLLLGNLSINAFEMWVQGADRLYSVKNISPSTTVQEVKQQIADQAGVDVSRLKLLYGGKSLSNDMPLQELGRLSDWGHFMVVGTKK